MADRINQKPQGFAVVDPRWTTDNLLVNDGTSGNSDYTEANPEPGQMTLAATTNYGRIQISGGQAVTVEAVCGSGGSPAYESGGVIYRLDGETADTDYRGWNPPNHPTWWSGVNDAYTSIDDVSIAVVKKTQQPHALAGQYRRYNSDDADWDELTGTGGNTRANLISAGTRLFIVDVIQPGRIQTSVSDDNGTTWALSSEWHGTITAVTSTTAGADGNDSGEFLLIVRGSDGYAYQYASVDFGATWTLISSDVIVASQLQVSELPAGGFLSCSTTSLGIPTLRILGSASDSISDAVSIYPHGAVVISAGRFATWPDPDGFLWSIVGTTATTGIEVAYSGDNGTTWTTMDLGLCDFTVTADYISNFRAAAVQGGAMLVHSWTGSTSALQGWGCWFIGGWSRPESAGYAGGDFLNSRQAFGLPDTGITAAWTHTWLPFELPDNMGTGWTFVGATQGVINHRASPLSGSIVDMEINTSAAIGNYQAAGLAASSDNVIMAQFQVLAGGSTSSGQVSFGSRWADGAADYRVRIYASTTQFAVYDVHGTTALATVTVSGGLITQSIAVLMYHSGATVQVYYRLPGIESQWILAVNSDAVTDGGAVAATSLTYFGHLASSTSQSLWHSVHSLSDAPAPTVSVREYRHGTDTSADLELRGRWLTSAPMPIPEVGSSTDAAFAALTRGPILQGEVMTVEPSHRHPVDHIFPTISASPADEWRSTDDTADVRIALDFTRSTMLDGSWAYVLGLVNTNVQTAKLEGWDGSAWVTVGTYNGATDFESMAYDLTGDILRPKAYSGTAVRIHNGVNAVLWTATNITGSKMTAFSADYGYESSLSNKIDNPALNDVWQYDKGSAQALTGYTAMTGFILVAQNWDTDDTVELYGWDGAAEVGTRVSIGSYIDITLTGRWQRFTIPLADMTLTGETVSGFRMQQTARSGSAALWYLDDWQIEQNQGTSNGGRFLQSGELVGGHIVLDTGGTPKVRKVLHQTGGAWTHGDKNTTKPWIRLEGIDGTEAATGNADFVSTGGALYVYPSTLDLDHYERFSLLIETASNDTSEGYYKIGAAPLGAVTVVGQQWGRGWSRAKIPNTSSYRDGHGTTRRREEGPPARRWVMSWQSGLDLGGLRLGPDQPYLSAAAGSPPLAASQDVWWQLSGLLDDSKSGQVPVIACARFPAVSGTTITDPTGWLYGTLSGTVQANNIVGDEMESEAMRVESITIEELV